MGHVGAVGLVLHPKRDCALAIELVTRWAASRGVAVFGVAGELDGVMGVQLLEQHRIAEKVDLLVSLGGDGTMLRALRLAYHHQVPVLGVNLGKFGFLAEIDPPDLDEALCSIAEERFEMESRVAVQAVVGDTVRIAFNDIADRAPPPLYQLGDGHEAKARQVQDQVPGFLGHGDRLIRPGKRRSIVLPDVKRQPRVEAQSSQDQLGLRPFPGQRQSLVH